MADKRPSRKRKYTPEVHRAIVKAIRAGRPKGIAGAMAGLHPDLIWTWLKQGHDQPDVYPEYARLAEDVEKAQAEWAGEALDRIEGAAKADSRNWTADAWRLERMMPAEFAKRDKVEIETSTPLVQVNQLILGDPDARDEARSLLQRVAGSHMREIIEGKASEVADD